MEAHIVGFTTMTTTEGKYTDVHRMPGKQSRGYLMGLIRNDLMVRTGINIYDVDQISKYGVIINKDNELPTVEVPGLNLKYITKYTL